jgi:hypothetical protein
MNQGIIQFIFNFISKLNQFTYYNRETLREILLLLRNTSNQQAESMVKTMKKWARDNKVNV